MPLVFDRKDGLQVGLSFSYVTASTDIAWNTDEKRFVPLFAERCFVGSLA
jgi:hypothetical protein